jgi:membrane fusion protein, multidrug efflux system
MNPSARKIWLVMFAVAMFAVASIAAGCGSSSNSNNEEAASAAKSEQAPATSTQAENVPPASIKLVIKSDEEHAKKGPEGQWHDAYLPANFSVDPGQKVNVTVYNYDEGTHSFTSTSLGVNEVISGGSETKPHKATFSFTAPTKAGKYEWWCALPCDPWAMEHKGFMRGEVTVS